MFGLRACGCRLYNEATRILGCIGLASRVFGLEDFRFAASSMLLSRACGRQSWPKESWSMHVNEMSVS